MNYNAAGYEEQARHNAEIGIPAAVILAPIWRRIIGQIIDQFVVVIPIAFVAVALGVRRVDELAQHEFAVQASVVAVAFTYQWLMVGMWGRTVGKFALGTRVVRVDTAGRVPWSSAAIRALVPLAAGAIPKIGQFLTLMVYGSAIFDRRRQGWHDKAAGTIVVMNDSRVVG